MYISPKRFLVIALAAIFSISCHAQPAILGPFSTAINISGDLTGVVGACPDTWGGCASYASPIQFHPPVGYRVRILRIHGDFIIAPKTGIVQTGQRSEYGFGIKTTAPDGDSRISFPGYTQTPNANSFLWIQGWIGAAQPEIRVPLGYDTHVGGLLGTDNTALFQAFVALDTTGLTYHYEPTMVVLFQYEPVVQ